MSRASNVSRDSTYSMGSLQTGLSGDTGSLPSLMAQNDWEIAPMDIEIMRREDGSPWELGAGAFGKVRACTALCASQNSCMLHVRQLGQNASASWHGRLVVLSYNAGNKNSAHKGLLALVIACPALLGCHVTEQKRESLNGCAGVCRCTRGCGTRCRMWR